MNGVGVSQTKELSDGTLVLVVYDLLFNWRERVQRAFEDLQVRNFPNWRDKSTRDFENLQVWILDQLLPESPLIISH